VKDDFLRIAGRNFALAGEPVRIKGTNYRDQAGFRTFRDWMGDRAVVGNVDSCVGLGMNAVRIDLAWGEGEEEGELLPLVRRFFSFCRARGLRLYFFLKWPRPFAPAGTLEDALNKTYLREVMDTFASEPGVIAWDLGNELDHISHERWHWSMDLSEAARRLHFMRRMADEIRGLDDSHPISMGATFSYSYWVPQEPLALLDFVDFVDFHYYRRNYRDSTLAEEIAEVRSRTDKPILLGEIGRSSDPDYHPAGEEENDEERQADAYRRYIADVAGSDAVGFLQWTLLDYRLYEPGETFYGIHRVDGSAKPAAAVVRDSFEAWPGPGEW